MTIDTLSFVKHLEAAGVPRAQAEAHAEALRDDIAPQLVTNADLGAAVDRLETRLEAVEGHLEMKIDAVESRLAVKIDAVESRLAVKIDAVENRLEVKIGAVENQLEARIDAVESRLESKIEAMLWKHTVAILLAMVAVADLMMRFAR